jgi:DNA repair ATPase RecN
MKIAQSSPDPAERQILTQKALELSDIREYNDIMEKLDTVKNAQSKLKDIQEAYNRLMETSKQIENKFINVSLENRILKKVMDKETLIEGKFAEIETKLNLADEIANKKIKPEQKPGQ